MSDTIQKIRAAIDSGENLRIKTNGRAVTIAPLRLNEERSVLRAKDLSDQTVKTFDLEGLEIVKILPWSSLPPEPTPRRQPAAIIRKPHQPEKKDGPKVSGGWLIVIILCGFFLVALFEGSKPNNSTQQQLTPKPSASRTGTKNLISQTRINQLRDEIRATYLSKEISIGTIFLIREPDDIDALYGFARITYSNGYKAIIDCEARLDKDNHMSWSCK